MRGDLQVRQGDTVYVLRDIPIDDKRPDVSQNGDKNDSPKTKRQDRKKLKLSKGKDKTEETVGSKVSRIWIKVFFTSASRFIMYQHSLLALILRISTPCYVLLGQKH